MNLSPTKRYYLLLADIEGTTRLEPAVLRKATGSLNRKVRSLNTRYGSSLAVPLKRSYGDEIAALLISPEQLYDMADGIRESLYPHARVRFVFTSGRIGVPSRDITVVGGPIFKEAQALMLDLKKRRGLFAWKLGSGYLDTILNALSGLTSSLIEDLTDYRRSIWRSLRTGQTQRQIARMLHRHPQSVSQAIGRGHIKSIIQGEQAIRAALGAISKPVSVYPRRSNRK